MIKVVFGFREYFCKFVALTRYIYTHLLLMNDTKGQFEHIIGICRDLFVKKLHDYGASWRIMRPESITDQIFIKAKRIRNLEIKKVSQVGEGVYPEFVGIVNYGIVGLIQLDMGFASTVDISIDQAVALYDKFMDKTKELMLKKNADYDEAWRDMRINSYTDLIGTKGIVRMTHDFKTAVVDLHGITRTEKIEKPYGGKNIDTMCALFADSIEAGKLSPKLPTLRDSAIASDYAWKFLDDARAHDLPAIGTLETLEQIRERRRTMTNGYGLLRHNRKIN